MGSSERVATATRSSSEASSNKLPGNAALAVTQDGTYSLSLSHTHRAFPVAEFHIQHDLFIAGCLHWIYDSM